MVDETEDRMDKTVEAGISKTPLARAIADLKDEARAAGLTDADIDAELSAHKDERRGRDRRLVLRE